MLRCRKQITILLCLSIFTATMCSYADEEIEDLIDIAESNGKIIAIIEGKKTVSFDLRLKEEVLWSGSKGYLGAFLTNYRFFVISTSLGAWQVLNLKSDEPEKAIVSLSPYIALLATKDRVIGYDALSNQFIKTQLPLSDELLVAEAGKHVAVVVTSNRALGLAAKASFFIEVRLRIRETLEEVKVTSSKATVRTSDRLLTFGVPGSTWHEHRLN